VGGEYHPSSLHGLDKRLSRELGCIWKPSYSGPIGAMHCHTTNSRRNKSFIITKGRKCSLGRTPKRVAPQQPPRFGSKEQQRVHQKPDSWKDPVTLAGCTPACVQLDCSVVPDIGFQARLSYWASGGYRAGRWAVLSITSGTNQTYWT
jgi:hypothetical protein